jgi:muramoyltetrapeptide carboxypeptidase
MTKFLTYVVWFMASISANANSYQNTKFIEEISNLKIHMVSPASSSPEATLAKLAKIKSIKIPKACLVPSASTMPIVSDDVRFECLKDAINDDSTDIVWALRGGYGSARLIDKLLDLPKPKKEKIFIGYSDITALHLFFSQKWGWKTIHGAVLREIYEDDKSQNNLIKIADFIKQRLKIIQIEDLKPMNKTAEKSGTISGKITGGNLKIIETSIGTNWEIDSKDKILFLEEVGDAEYQIDRALLHLKQADLLNVKAIIFGSFDSGSGKDLEIAIKKFAVENSIPAFKTDKFGHSKFNYPIIYNSTAKIGKKNGVINLEMTMD